MAGAVDVPSFGVRFLGDEASFRRTVVTPVLVWEAPPETPEEPLLFSTRAGQMAKRPRRGAPMFFFVQKSVKNAFADEVTLGRTANNDISVEDNSVSRFHAYFARTKKGASWSLVDAKSTAGTFLAGKQLEPRTPMPVSSGVRLRVGDVELQFLDPAGFWRYLQKLIRAK